MKKLVLSIGLFTISVLCHAQGTANDAFSKDTLTGINSYSATIGAVTSAFYYDMQKLWCVPARTNTGASTLNITNSSGNSLGAVTIYKTGGVALTGGELIAGTPYLFTYLKVLSGFIITAGNLGTGSVTSVSVSGTNGISSSGSPITTSGTITVSGAALIPFTDTTMFIATYYYLHSNYFNLNTTNIIQDTIYGNYTNSPASVYLDSTDFRLQWNGENNNDTGFFNFGTTSGGMSYFDNSITNNVSSNLSVGGGYYQLDLTNGVPQIRSTFSTGGGNPYMQQIATGENNYSEIYNDTTGITLSANSTVDVVIDSTDFYVQWNSPTDDDTGTFDIGNYNNGLIFYDYSFNHNFSDNFSIGGGNYVLQNFNTLTNQSFLAVGSPGVYTVNTAGTTHYSINYMDSDSISLTSANIKLNGALRINNGSEANGKVLTSDAIGNATWQSPGSSGVTSVTGSGNIASSGGTTPNITFTGTLPIANGGTNGTATPTTNGIAYGTGTSIAYTGAGSTGTYVLAETNGGTPSMQSTSILGAWNLTGNTLTYGKFIGTTDTSNNASIVGKIDNVQSLLIDSSPQTTYIGFGAGVPNIVGGETALTAIGAYAGATVSGSRAASTFIGNGAGNGITTGSQNIIISAQDERLINSPQWFSTGNNNVIISTNAVSGTNINQNTCINCSGEVKKYDTYVGYGIGYNVLGGSRTAIGAYAGASLNTNSFVFCGGDSAGYNCNTGSYNTFIAHCAGFNVRSGAWNTYTGAYCGSTDSIGSKNSFYGAYTGNNGQTMNGNSNGGLGDSSFIRGLNATNAFVFGSHVLAHCSNCMVLGSIANINGATANTKVAIGDTAPRSMLDVGLTHGFQVDSTGNIDTLKGVGYLFPSSQGAANSVLTNNGSGTLTWTYGQLPHTIFTPTTGNTITMLDNTYNIINPTGAILALTLVFPASPANNDVVEIKFDQGVTTVTYPGNVNGGIITVPLGTYTKFTYDTATTTWY